MKTFRRGARRSLIPSRRDHPSGLGPLPSDRWPERANTAAATAARSARWCGATVCRSVRHYRDSLRPARWRSSRSSLLAASLRSSESLLMVSGRVFLFLHRGWTWAASMKTHSCCITSQQGEEPGTTEKIWIQTEDQVCWSNTQGSVRVLLCVSGCSSLHIDLTRGRLLVSMFDHFLFKSGQSSY